MVDVPLGGESYQVVYDNGAGTSSAVAVKPSCAAGAFESPAGCVAKLSYAPVVYGLADLAYPVRVSGTSCASMKVEVAKNETRFQAGYLPHFNAWMRYGMLPSGRLLVSAQMVSDNNARHAVALNPVTNVLSDYAAEEGPVPSLNDPIDPGWHRVSVSDNPNPIVGGWAETPSMLIYVPRSDARILSCKDKATGVVTVLTRDLGSFSFLATYSN